MAKYLGTYYEIWDYISDPHKIKQNVAALTGIDIKTLTNEVETKWQTGEIKDRGAVRHYIKRALNRALEEKGCKVRVV